MGFIMLKSSQAQITQLKNYLIVFSVTYGSYVKSSEFKEEFGIELKASINPRQKQTIEKELPRGMNKLTPYGELICNEGREMEYQGYD